MKKSYSALSTITLGLYSAFALSADIFYADKQFTEQNYTQALAAYKEAATIGNPHAYYQLGKMYLNGYGTESSIIDSIAYYALAAEQDFHNAEKILQQMIELLPADSHDAIYAFIAETRKKNDYVAIQARYFPVPIEARLDTRITFDGEASLPNKYYPDDFDWTELEGGPDTSFSDDEGDFEGIEGFDDPFATLLTQQTTPFLIVDHDIHHDGSIRYTAEVQKYGLFSELLNEFVLFPIAKPSFADQSTEFTSRAFLGAATYNKFTLLRENENMYRTILMKKRQFAESPSLNDQFNYAMLLLNFPWLAADDTEAEQVLLGLAKQGHSPAMYEYGIKLYREQRELKTAIRWITEAAKYGLIRAEYRLGKLLQSSPWVQKDEKKALFWYQSAMDKGDIDAGIRAAELLLNAADTSLRDISLATDYLAVLEPKVGNNPEYFYLKALSVRTGPNRDIAQTIRYLKDAIFKAQMANWDTTEWDNLYSQITQGSVSVRDEN